MSPNSASWITTCATARYYYWCCLLLVLLLTAFTLQWNNAKQIWESSSDKVMDVAS